MLNPPDPNEDVFRAVKLEDLDSLRRWLSSSHNPNVVDNTKKRSSLLHWACYLGSRDAAETLLENGADINIKETDGKTPIHWAAFEGHHAVCVLLLQHRADYTTTDTLKKTPCELALMNGHIDVARLFPNFRDCVLNTASFDKELTRDWKPSTPPATVVEVEGGATKGASRTPVRASAPPVSSHFQAAAEEDLEIAAIQERPELVQQQQQQDVDTSRTPSPAPYPTSVTTTEAIPSRHKKEKKEKKEKKSKKEKPATCSIEVQTDYEESGYNSRGVSPSIADTDRTLDTTGKRMIPRSEKLRRKEMKRQAKDEDREKRRLERRQARQMAKSLRRREWLEEVEREAQRIAAISRSNSPPAVELRFRRVSQSVDPASGVDTAATTATVHTQDGIQPTPATSTRRSRSEPRKSTNPNDRGPWRPPSDPVGKGWGKYCKFLDG